MPSFRLRLEDTYWSKGFFNVGVDNQRWVTMTEGPFHLYLGDAAEPVVGRVSRSANPNATPRIYGNKPLAEFLQKNYRPGDVVEIEIISPTSLRVGRGGLRERLGAVEKPDAADKRRPGS